MLIDKGYYDYDFDAKVLENRQKRTQRKERTHEEKQSLFTRMGFGRVKRLGEDSPLTPDEMQRIAMAEVKVKK